MSTKVSNQADMDAIKAAEEKRVRKAELRKLKAETLKSKTIPSPEAIARATPVDMAKFQAELEKKREEKLLLAKAKKEAKDAKFEGKNKQAEPASSKISRLRQAHAIAKALQGEKVKYKVPEKKQSKHVRTPEEEKVHLENLSAVRIARREKKQEQRAQVERQIAKLKAKQMVKKKSPKAEWIRKLQEDAKATPKPNPRDVFNYVLTSFEMAIRKDGSFEKQETKKRTVSLNPQAVRKYINAEHEQLLGLHTKDAVYYGVSITPVDNPQKKLTLINTKWKKQLAA